MTERDAAFSRRRDRLALRTYLRSADSSVVGLGSDYLVEESRLTDVDLGDHVAVADAGTLWVLDSEVSSRVTAMSAALAWLVRQPTGVVQRLALVARHSPRLAARRLANFTIPAQVFAVVGEGITRVEPEPHLPVVEANPRHLEIATMFATAGADVVVEHGVVAAEVVGLEVARIIEENGVPTVRIGVGAHDRETFRMVHGEEATLDQLRAVVQSVALHRRPDAGAHPLNLLARERAIRHRMLTNPSAIGMKTLAIIEPPVRRDNLKDAVPCCAIGRSLNDDDVVVVFTSGVDLDAVPFAADARARLDTDARIMIVTESRNIVPLQLRIAELVNPPAEFRGA